MTVGEVMSRDVEFIAPEASAQEAPELMGETSARSRWAMPTAYWGS